MDTNIRLQDILALITVVLAFIPIISGVTRYLNIKASEEQSRQFINYHKMIADLVQNATYVHRQMASVYELRNYPNYYPVTLRILRSLKVSWSQSQNMLDVLAEMDLTIAYIEQKLESCSNCRSSKLARIFIRN